MGLICDSDSHRYKSTNYFCCREQKYKSTGNPAKFILKCKSTIYEKLECIWNIDNEAEVRYLLADPLVDMVCDSFGYRLELEDTSDEIQTQTNMSSKSKVDYVCWVLNKRGSFRDAVPEENVSVVILEIKHKVNVSDGFAQTLGYYVKSKSETGTD